MIRDNKDAILIQWSALARDEIPAARRISEADLLNNFPAVLDRIADFISTTAQSEGGERHSAEVMDAVEQHGRHRARLPGYTLDQVIEEYRLLRYVIMHVLEFYGPLSPKEIEKLLEAIDLGVSRAATEFAVRKGFKAARLRAARRSRDEVTKERDVAQTLAHRLEEESALREQFISTLSHDLRTPLTAAKAIAELIAKKVDRVDMAKKLSIRILGDLNRTDKMIRDLLDASRIRAGNPLPLKIDNEVKINFKDLAQSAIECMSVIHGNRFVLDADPMAEGFWSKDDLRRVIENLVSNGIKYGAPDQPIVIRIKTRDTGVVLSVHNTGPVIPRAEIPKLFHSYSRMNEQARKKTGWGLGLTLVKGIAEAHGGRVWVSSKAGSGTTFTVTLPWDSRSSKTSGQDFGIGAKAA